VLTAMTMLRRRWGGAASALCLALALLVAGRAAANHDTDCTVSGGTNGPAQLDCSLPDFVAVAGSTTPLTAKFVYTPSTDRDPVTCAVGTMTVAPSGEWLSIDTTVLNAQAPPFAQEVMVRADPSGLPAAVYEGSVAIKLEIGQAPECPSSPSGLMGTVSVRLRVVPPVAAPALGRVALLVVAFILGLFGVRALTGVRGRS